MARKGSKGEKEKQPSLFGEGLPEALPPTKTKARSSRRSPSAIPSPPEPAPPAAGNRISRYFSARWAPITLWLRKVVAEAAHKLAVKSAIVLMIGLAIAAALGFFAVLKFDHTPLLARFFDFIEKQIYAGHRLAPPGPAINTGSPPPPSPLPAPGMQSTPQEQAKPLPWIVDVFPERD